MSKFNIEYLRVFLLTPFVSLALISCGGGSSSGSSAAAPVTSSGDSGAVAPAIDPATGSVAATEVTCQAACVSLSADAGTSTD